MKSFQGRVVAPGRVSAEALVSHGGLNTLASFQKALQFGDKKATCGDQNNPDLYGKQQHHRHHRANHLWLYYSYYHNHLESWLRTTKVP